MSDTTRTYCRTCLDYTPHAWHPLGDHQMLKCTKCHTITSPGARGTSARQRHFARKFGRAPRR